MVGEMMRILVVEDDLEAQRYLVQGLKESGHVVDEAADGETGLSLALSRPYDVAGLDRMLPAREGVKEGGQNGGPREFDTALVLSAFLESGRPREGTQRRRRRLLP